MITTFGQLPEGAIFTDRGGGRIRYEKIAPVQVGPQVFCAALVDAADEAAVFGTDAGPGWPHDVVVPYIPRGPDGRALTYRGRSALVRWLT